VKAVNGNEDKLFLMTAFGGEGRGRQDTFDRNQPPVYQGHPAKDCPGLFQKRSAVQWMIGDVSAGEFTFFHKGTILSGNDSAMFFGEAVSFPGYL
jgi:hypothetical protein